MMYHTTPAIIYSGWYGIIISVGIFISEKFTRKSKAY